MRTLLPRVILDGYFSQAVLHPVPAEYDKGTNWNLVGSRRLHSHVTALILGGLLCNLPPLRAFRPEVGCLKRVKCKRI